MPARIGRSVAKGIDCCGCFNVCLTLSLPTVTHFGAVSSQKQSREKVNLTKIAPFDNFVARRNSRESGIEAEGCTVSHKSSHCKQMESSSPMTSFDLHVSLPPSDLSQEQLGDGGAAAGLPPVAGGAEAPPGGGGVGGRGAVRHGARSPSLLQDLHLPPRQ